MRNRSAVYVFWELNGPSGYILDPRCEGGIRNRRWYPKSWLVSEILGGIRNPGWYPKSWVVSEILGGIRNRRLGIRIVALVRPNMGDMFLDKFPQNC